MGKSATLAAPPTFVCLTGCTISHEVDDRFHQCTSYAEIGTVLTDVEGQTIRVQALGTSEDTETFACVLVERTDLHPDLVSDMTSAQARALAALLVRAADQADLLAIRPKTGA